MDINYLHSVSEIQNLRDVRQKLPPHIVAAGLQTNATSWQSAEFSCLLQKSCASLRGLTETDCSVLAKCRHLLIRRQLFTSCLRVNAVSLSGTVIVWRFGDKLPPTRQPMQSAHDWRWLLRGWKCTAAALCCSNYVQLVNECGEKRHHVHMDGQPTWFFFSFLLAAMFASFFFFCSVTETLYGWSAGGLIYQLG